VFFQRLDPPPTELELVVFPPTEKATTHSDCSGSDTFLVYGILDLSLVVAGDASLELWIDL
jgi:hypothetical protein